MSPESEQRCLRIPDKMWTGSEPWSAACKAVVGCPLYHRQSSAMRRCIEEIFAGAVLESVWRKARMLVVQWAGLPADGAKRIFLGIA